MSPNIPPQSDAVRKAAAFVADARKDDPSRKLHSIVDEASMRFNLSPLEGDALAALFKEEKEATP